MSSDEAFVVRVLAALKSARLEAIVVGNVAAILQGVPVTTQDLDLLIRDTPRNHEKVAALGRALGARARKISALTSTLRLDLRAGTVDLLFDALSGNLTFESLRSRAVRLRLGGEQAIVARLEDVIASKEAADRPKDRAQLPTLRDTLRVRHALDATGKPKKR
jgi:predicted nucleotidyltransferase